MATEKKPPARSIRDVPVVAETLSAPKLKNTKPITEMNTNAKLILDRLARSLTASLFTAACLLAPLAETAHAQSGTWTNNSGSGNWSAAINWQGGIVASGVDSTATFSPATNLFNTITLDEPLTIGNLVFTPRSPSPTNYDNFYLVGNNTLTLQTDTGIPPNISVETNTTIIGVPLSSSQMVTITNAYGGHGSYVWALTNQANNLAGGLTLQAGQGTFFTTNATSVPSLGGGSGTIYIGQAVGAGQIGFNVSATNVANSVTNADGSPSIIIPNNFVNQSIRWIFDQSPSVGNAQPVNITGNVLLNSGTANVRDFALQQPLTISGVLSGGSTYGLIFGALSSTMTLSNPNNSFTGGITFNNAGSTLAVNSDGALGFIQNGLTFTTTGTLRVNASFATARKFTLTATATINVQTNLLEIDNGSGTAILGAGGLTVNGLNNGILNTGGLYNGGELLLTGANSFTGAVTVNGGALVNGPGSSLASTAAATVATNATWICDSVSFPSIPTFTVNTGGLLVFSNSSPALSATVSLVDNGTLDVSAVSGGFTLNSGQTLIGKGGVNGPFTAASGAAISPGTVGTAGTLSFTNGLTLNGQMIQFDLTTNTVEGGGTNDEIVVDSLTLSGGETILLNYLNGSLAAGTYKLIHFTSSLNGTFALVTSYPNVTIDNGLTTPNYVTLIVTGNGSLAPALTWEGDGSANVWDVLTTANWVTNFANAPLQYSDPSKVTFNDFGSNNVPVMLNTTVRPGLVTFNITNKAYTLAGSGSISGVTSLTINGGNTLTNLLQNNYGGGTVLNNASKLVLGNGGTTGSAGSGTITMGNTTAQVIVNENTAVNLPTLVGSGGTPQVIQNGSGTTTLTGSTDNSYLGAVVNNGTLVLGKTSTSSVHALGGATTVNAKGTLQLAGVGGYELYSGVTVTLAGGIIDANGQKDTFTKLTGYGTAADTAGGGVLTLSAAPGLNVSGGVMNANGTLLMTNTPGFQVQSGGTLNLLGGADTYGSSTTAGVNAGGVFNMSGGSLSTGTYFAIGSSATAVATANFSGGSFVNAGEFLQGFGGLAVVTFSGSASLSLNDFSYGNNTLTNWFNGGTVATAVFHQRGSGNWTAFFNGGTIQAKSTQASFMPDSGTYYANQNAYISTNGLMVDCQNFNIGIKQNFQHDPSLGAGFDGGLTKIGSGSLTLTGTNTFNGSLTNSAGTLVFNNNGSYNNVVIGDNAVNQVNLVSAGTSLTNNTLTVGTSGSGTQGLNFNLGTFGNPTAPLMVVNGVVTNNGSVLITLIAPVLSPGTIPLLRYGSMDAANFASTWSVNSYPYVSLTLTNDTVQKLVSIIVVPGITPKWKGNLSSEWDTTTFNWLSNGVAATYNEGTPPGEPVTFDDSAVNFTVDISSMQVNPLFISMTNGNNNYTFTGTLGIGGTGALFKSGAGALILSNTPGANTYSGITLINGGSVVAGAANLLSPNSAMTFNSSMLNIGTNNQAIGAISLNNTPLLGNGTLTGNGGALTFNNGSSSFTLGAVLAGNVTLNFNGAGEMTITNNDATDSGVANINSGSVRVQNGNGLGLGGFNDNDHTVIASGARLVLDGSFSIPKYFYLSGNGPDGVGCLIVTNGNVVVNGSPCHLDGSYPTIYVSAGSSILFQGAVGGNNTKFYAGGVTKSGPGTLSMDAGGNNPSGMIINQGSLVTSNTTTSGFISVNNGAALAGSGSFQGALTVAAGATLTPDQNNFIGTLTSSGGLTNAGAMTLQLLKTATVTNADQISCSGNFVNNGTLTVITNLASTVPLAAGDSFKLFTLTNYAALAGLTPTLPVLPSSLAWTNGLAVNGTIAVMSTGPGVFTLPTGITGFSLAPNGTDVVITGTNGQAGDAYYLLSSTNLTLPPNQWTAVATNVPSVAGPYTFTATNAVFPGVQQQFFMLSNTNF